MLLSLFTAEGMIGLVTLVLLEIVLGIDNIIFIAILTGYLPKKDQQRARALGLTMAMVFRIVLLLGISWLVHLTEPLFQVGPLSPSGRDLILFAGGVFLVFKTLKEIIHKLSAPELDENGKVIKEKKLTVTQAILQIALIDIVFSFDSILTAVGLSSDLQVMITAVVISMIVMLLFAPYVSNFINKYPTIKMLALAFLVCIGGLLIVEAFHLHIEKSYVYVAMGFSLIVEMLNIRLRQLHRGSSH
ncbi:MAG: TerC family protein [Bacteroidota bacterium]|jgi:predicted tellurium resistance membrane protein TerC|uniref:TerC family protein n=1 Tax=Candidatus Pollutiaquabacter sp. TaxID=3416354 RepID=UPI001A463F58|nr:TerC family protein [Bacteroidota bacterium]MBL7948501.1 TerC family protein [Bacteroidia bacterium]MBP6009427.1 TerC family protein [Bacteroidia bacterium]MBP7269962.1 TerC family protein [Bacteroidia bacterium]MBP7437760.1 TerC family protein [Bacteroidia bacterium]